MAYRIEDEETLPTASRRVGRELLDNAIVALSARRASDGVQAARKDFKKLRALLSMVADEFDPDSLTREDTTVRDAGRALAGARDSQALVSALDTLHERFGNLLRGTAFNSIRRQLMRERRAAMKEFAASDAKVPEIVSSLEGVRDRIDDWPVRRDKFRAIRPRLRRAYARGRNGFARVSRDQTSHNVHAWRKAAKELWYQTRLLQRVWPRLMKRYAAELSDLCDQLGEDHDLAILRDTVLDRAAKNSKLDDAGALIALIDERRAQLQVAALDLGARVYAERPRDYVKRMKQYWRAARRIQARGPEAVTEQRVQ